MVSNTVLQTGCKLDDTSEYFSLGRKCQNGEVARSFPEVKKLLGFILETANQVAKVEVCSKDDEIKLLPIKNHYCPFCKTFSSRAYV